MATSGMAVLDPAAGGGLAGAVALFPPPAASGGRGVCGPGDVVADPAGGFAGPVLGEVAACAKSALVTGLVALAGPRFGTQYEEVVPRGSDLYVLIDVSRSMLAEDVPPSRLGRAKADVAALVNRLEGERVGLIAFAGQAVVKCPLTVDYDAFRRSLDELDPAVRRAAARPSATRFARPSKSFRPGPTAIRRSCLITDGDDQQSYPLEAAAVAAERHVTIFTVGLGDADHGARIPQGAGHAKSYRRVPGAAGLEQARRLAPQGDRAQDVRRLCPGGNPRLRSGRALREIPSGPARQRTSKASKRIRRADQFQIFLALALLALLADAFTRPYPARSSLPRQRLESRRASARAAVPRARRPAVPVATALVLVASLAGVSRADNPADAVREGLRWYGKGEFDKAARQFAAAREQFDSGDAGQGRDRRVRPGLRLASQGRRGASPGMVPEGWSCARQGTGGLGPLQPGNAGGGGSTPAGGRTARKTWRLKSARRFSTS